MRRRRPAEIASINFTRVLRDGYFRIRKSAAAPACLCGLRRLRVLDVAGIGARQMAFESPSGAIGSRSGSRRSTIRATSVRTLCVRIEQAQIRDDVFLVVDGQN